MTRPTFAPWWQPWAWCWARDAEFVAHAHARISERAADIRSREVAAVFADASSTSEELARAESMLSQTYLWKRIELWEAVEKAKVEIARSIKSRCIFPRHHFGRHASFDGFDVRYFDTAREGTP